MTPLRQRQDSDPVQPPTAAGVRPDAALTIDTAQANSISALTTDPNALPGAGPTIAPPLAITHTPIITITPTPATASPLPQDPSSSVQASGGSSRTPIPMSTVVGSCVGAFIGAVALICLGFWFYRRYVRSLKHSRSPGPLNTRANLHRRRSHREPWDKLEDANPEDKWDGVFKQVATQVSVAPMEKLTSLKKTPSIHTTYIHPEDPPRFEIPHPFAQYPVTNANRSEPSPPPDSGDVRNPVPTPTPLVNHNDDTSHVLSWNTAAKTSFLTVGTHIERLSGAMSPTLNMAIPTPPATASAFHHWESAEIVNFDGQSAEIVNPFSDEHKHGERRKSTRNPFFGAHEDIPRRRSRSNSVASRARTNSTATSIYVPIPRVDKGKGRAIDPFDDDDQTRVPPPPAMPTISTSIPTEETPPIPQLVPPTHNSTGSGSSGNDRALASLLAALDGELTEEEVQARLRIASFQPSISSMYSEGEEDVTKEFPLPPQSAEPLTPTVESYVTAASGRTLRA